MMKFKLGLLLGFGAGWAVGSGRATELLHDIQDRASARAGSDGGPTGTVAESAPDGSSFSDRTSISA